MNSTNTAITQSGRYGYYWLTIPCNEGPRRDIENWIKENFAIEECGHSYFGSYGDSRMTIAFINRADAILTKLIWA